VAEAVEEVDMAEDEEGSPALSMVSTLVTRTESSFTRSEWEAFGSDN
jgi:hypothetical protein